MNAALAGLVPARLVPAEFARGSVWLVGAGPGDPGLLTLHAAHALATADVILHDALVAADILALAVTPRIHAVGKRAGGARTHQLRINQRLIALAREGARVLRLKGGDPLVFGRGGEEALALAAAKIPFRIVPGITAGLGAAASAGIPLTHRMLGHSVAFATGHDVHGGLPRSLDIPALSRGADVLVFYMALRHAGALAAALIAAGRAPDEPAAFISDATTPRQHVAPATLATVAAVAATLDSTAPTLFVTGPVLALRSMLATELQTAPMHLADLPAASMPAVR
ncbi:MAG: uroporphyrinogen-III C-methyltransferase [Acidisphaera sp.]|nr:uroporphyrinogen-III C-methyltransferase [Acidisphaera sp.]